MCGLVGVFGNIFSKDIKMMEQLLFIDQIRGAHSTGLATVSGDRDVKIYKRALAAADFLQLSKADKLLSVTADVIIGHNRYATSGSITDDTAHPFQHREITLVHNGTLTSRNGLCEERKAVDSEHICLSLVGREGDDIKELLESLHGAFALVWYDSSLNTLNFARNEERPLFFANTDNVTFWASRKEMLELVLVENKVSKYEIIELQPGKWASVQVATKSDRKYKVTDFTPYTPPPPPARTTVNRRHGDKVTVEFSSFKSSKNNKVDLFGHVLDSTNDKVAAYNVDPKRIKWAGNNLDDDFVYDAEVSYSSGYNVSLKALSLTPVNLEDLFDGVDEEDDQEKKSDPPSDKGVTIDGYYFKNGTKEDIMEEGCAWCGDKIDELELDYVTVTAGGDVLHAQCFNQYLTTIDSEEYVQ